MKLALVFLLVCVTTVVLAKKKNKPTTIPPCDDPPAQPKDGEDSFETIDPKAEPVTGMCSHDSI